ncbi:MAG: DedA family protein [Chloroflexi bacterium]|nr:DedA family protein [Chloroflexota bacterium]
MAAFLEWLYGVITSVIQAIGYPGIFLLMLIENLFPPIPSELIMPFSGFLIASGDMSPLGVMAAGTLGSLTGAVVIYVLSQKLGEDRLKEWVDRHGKFLLLSGDNLGRALKTFERRGKFALLLGRVIPGAHSLISIPAGLREIPWHEFLGLTLIGTLIWNSILIFAGFQLGSNWPQVLEYIDAYETLIWIAVGLLAVYFAARQLRKRRKS